MNEELLTELREFRRMLKSNYSDEDFKLMCARMAELGRLHTQAVLYEAADFVAKEQ